MIGFGLVFLFGAGPFLLAQVLWFDLSAFLKFSLVFLLLLLTGFLYHFKKTGSVWLFHFGLMYMGLVYVPYRSFAITHQLSWTTILWVFVLYLIARFTLRKWQAFVILAAGSASVWYTNSPAWESLGTKLAFQYWFQFFLAALIFLFFASVKDRVEKVMKQKQKANDQMENTQQMIASLNHEINNPLMIAIGSMDHFRSTGDKVHLDRMERSLDRVAKILQKIRSLEEIKVADYTQSLQMLQLGEESTAETSPKPDIATNTEIGSSTKPQHTTPPHPKTKEDWQNMLIHQMEEEEQDQESQVHALAD